jgi:hypothetical protein
MPEEFSDLNEAEKLKAENDFLKMKLMLEHGATFGGNENNELPAEMENAFLNNMMAFEKQFEEHKTIKVFDKIERPVHFKLVKDIPDSEIDRAWSELSDYLNKYGIDLSVCSPNITVRELYRFTTEELFEHETDDMDLPGWSTSFIYDEFHPDPVYDNSRLVQQDLFHDIFRKEELFCELQYVKNGFVFNNTEYTEYTEYKPYFEMISRFKSLFDEIELVECNVTNCSVSAPNCAVHGNYEASAKTGINEVIFKGDFKIGLVFTDLGYWDMKNIQIEGFNPE